MNGRLGQSDEGAGRIPVVVGSRRSGSGDARSPRVGAPIVRLLALVVALGAIAIAASPAQAVTFVNPISRNVAMIPSNLSGDSPAGLYNNLPVSTFVVGFPTESFGQFSFSSVGLNPSAATLSHFDTAVLNQVQTNSLSSGAKTAIAQFVANGGKLIIKDSDETSLNNYSWLFPGSSYSTQTGVAMHPLGERGGFSILTSNSSLLSTRLSDSSYVDLNDMYTFTDAISDANLLTSSDPRWFVLANGQDARHDQGAQLAYASNSNGLIIYDGYDTSFILQHATDPFQSQCTLTSPCPIHGSNPVMYYPTGSTVSKDWLAQIWYHQLLQPWGTPGGTGGGGGIGGGGGAGLPHNKPLATVGTPLAARLAGLPSNRLCVPSRRLALALKKLGHLHGRQVVRIDVFVNGKLVRTQRRHFRNITLKHLPRHGRYTVEVIATTNLGFQLIAHRRYHEC